MNKHLLSALLFIPAFLLSAQSLDAQVSSASAYLEKVTTGEEQITEDFLSYVSALAHGKTARKIEKRRTELINAVAQARTRVKNLPAYSDGDTSVQRAAYAFYTIDYNLLKEDYAKIVDMEEIAEESYDKMEAYLNAEEAADKKLEESFKVYDNAVRAFAASHGITIVNDQGKRAQKSEMVHKVNEYYHQVYLVFFKSYKQEVYLTTAVDKKDLNGIEQNKNTLIKNATEGLEKLNKVPPFDGDADLANACRAALQFYQREAKTNVPVISDFLLKTDNFEKLKKAMDGGGNHSKEQVDNYNKAIKDMNAAIDKYNRLNKEDNEARTKVINGWNDGAQNFLSKHTPRYNKH